MVLVQKKLPVEEEIAVAVQEKNKSNLKTNHQIWENRTEAKVRQNKKKQLKKQKKVEKDH